MQANTKLTDSQKESLQELCAMQPDLIVLNNGETTIAYRDLGNTVEFALSVAAPTEKKFRRKVGEFYVRGRFYDGLTVKMKCADFYRMREDTLGIFQY